MISIRSPCECLLKERGLPHKIKLIYSRPMVKSLVFFNLKEEKSMKKQMTRILSIMMTIVMIFTMLPLTVFAEETKVQIVNAYEP